jgi:hypothetical protein
VATRTIRPTIVSTITVMRRVMTPYELRGG